MHNADTTYVDGSVFSLLIYCTVVSVVNFLRQSCIMNLCTCHEFLNHAANHHDFDNLTRFYLICGHNFYCACVETVIAYLQLQF